MEFNLRQLTQQTLQDGGFESFAECAELVLDSIPSAHYRDALRVTLTDYVRHVNRQLPGDPSPAATTAGGHASRKVAGIGTAWTAFLARRIPTSDGQLRVLADANADEVQFYSQYLSAKARETQQVAAAFADLAKVMRQKKATRVRDLPADVGFPIARSAA